MYIIIVGGGNVGFYLAKTLVAANHEVLLLEKDRTRYRTISEELGEVVMQGDGCQADQQLEAGFSRADAVVATTGSDDDNMVVCQMAKMEFSVPRTISRVNDPRNEKLFHKLGIDATVSSTKIIYNLIEQEVGGGELIPLAALNRGNIEIVEVDIGMKSPVVGREIKSLALPDEALIISVIRNDHALLPAGETVLIDWRQPCSARECRSERGTSPRIRGPPVGGRRTSDAVTEPPTPSLSKYASVMLKQSGDLQCRRHMSCSLKAYAMAHQPSQFIRCVFGPEEHVLPWNCFVHVTKEARSTKWNEK